MLDLLQEQQRNIEVPLQTIITHYHQFTISQNHPIYYPYKTEVNDIGWGCAWRAIQTLLTNRNIHIPFPQLFLKYKQEQTLRPITQQHPNYTQEQLSALDQSEWIPQKHPQQWADPFTASLICNHLQLNNSLLLLNGYPHTNAPKIVFEKTIDFKQFVSIIKANISHTTIMIDDGIFALSIVGLRQINQNTLQFLFADPHINSNRQSKELGIYCKSFDLSGRPKGESRSQIQIKQALFNVYEILQFETKNWMICLLLS